MIAEIDQLAGIILAERRRDLMALDELRFVKSVAVGEPKLSRLAEVR
ncbi:hypothetical protein [Rhodopseudomonas faecalis]|nr:hypothetical protein [Rhodopseudomonas faecalis]